jgi:hypothetical protein
MHGLAAWTLRHRGFCQYSGIFKKLISQAVVSVGDSVPIRSCLARRGLPQCDSVVL